MKKSLIALSTIGVLLSNMAFAHPNHGKHPHNPEFHKAIGECFAEAGVKKPEMPQELKDKKFADKANLQKADKANGINRPEPPKDANGNPLPMPPKHKHGKHPKFEMTDAQKSQVESCLKQKGFEKPAKPEFKNGQAPKAEQK